MERFQRYDEPPRMMDRFSDQRRNYDDNDYQNDMNNYLPPRNFNNDDDLRGNVMM